MTEEAKIINKKDKMTPPFAHVADKGGKYHRVDAGTYNMAAAWAAMQEELWDCDDDR